MPGRPLSYLADGSSRLPPCSRRNTKLGDRSGVRIQVKCVRRSTPVRSCESTHPKAPHPLNSFVTVSRSACATESEYGENCADPGESRLSDTARVQVSHATRSSDGPQAASSRIGASRFTRNPYVRVVPLSDRDRSFTDRRDAIVLVLPPRSTSLTRYAAEDP